MGVSENLKTRVPVAIVYVAVLLVLFYLGGLYLTIGMLVAGIVSLFEVLKRLKIPWFGLLYIPLLAVLHFLPEESRFFHLLIPILFFTPFFIYYRKGSSVRILARIGIFLMLFILIAAGIRFTCAVREQMGAYIAFFILLSIWIYDNFAYFSGVIFGKRRIFGELSPKKSLEGLLGGMLFNLIFGIIWGFVFNGNIRSALFWGLISVFIGCISQLGDLYVSFFKRYMKIKDFSTLLGGHGGVLDRFDSIYFTFPLMYIIFGL